MIRGVGGTGGGRAAAPPGAVAPGGRPLLRGRPPGATTPRPQTPRRDSVRGNGEAAAARGGGVQGRRRWPWRGADGAGEGYQRAQDDGEQTARDGEHRVFGTVRGRPNCTHIEHERQAPRPEVSRVWTGVWAMRGGRAWVTMKSGHPNAASRSREGAVRRVRLLAGGRDSSLRFAPIGMTRST